MHTLPRSGAAGSLILWPTPPLAACGGNSLCTHGRLAGISIRLLPIYAPSALPPSLNP